MKIGAATVGSSMELLQKIKNESALWSSNLPSENLSEEIRNPNLKEYAHSSVLYGTVYSSRDMEAAQVSASRWVDNKAVYIYTMKYYLALKKKKKKEILLFTTAWVDLESMMLSEVS